MLRAVGRQGEFQDTNRAVGSETLETRRVRKAVSSRLYLYESVLATKTGITPRIVIKIGER